MTEKEFSYPIIEDEKRKLATLLGMLDPAEVDSDGLPLTARAVFIIDPAKKMRLSILYPATTGRNFEYGPAFISEYFNFFINIYLLL